MLRAVQETSVEAFRVHHASGHAAAQQARIIRYIEKHGGDWSIGELAHALDMEKSTVSARCNELVNENHELVRLTDKRKDRVSGVAVYAMKLSPKQEDLFL